MSPEQLDRLFHAYDIRGLAERELNCETAIAIARAFGDLMMEGDGRFVVGHDARLSSTSLAEAVSIGLRSGGHRVTHIGCCSTPLLYWYGAEGDFDGSVMITASHLPPEYNGFKLCSRDALPLYGNDGLREVRERIQIPLVFDRPCTPSLEWADPRNDYSCLLRPYLRGVGPLKIAVDVGSGVGGVSVDKVFDHFPHIWLHKLNFEPDGYFPHRSPDPFEVDALDGLTFCTKKHGCAFGIAFDGDADRAAVIDEAGNRVPPDLIGALLAEHFISLHPGATIVHDLRVSRVVREVIERAGGRAVPAPVGHPFIKRMMRKTGAVFALDLSGHCYYADLYDTDNALRTLIELAQLVSNADRPLSALVKPLRRYATSGNIDLQVHDRQAALAMLESAFADGEISHIDGVSVDYPDWWFNARRSRNEPLLRLSVGATDMDRLVEKIRAIREALGEFV